MQTKLVEKLKQEFRYLRDFAKAIFTGEVSPKQAVARMGQYANGIWNSFSRGRQQKYADLAATHEERIAVDDEGTCDDCHDYAARGIVPIGTLPEPGEKSICGNRCRCTKVYYRLVNGRFVRV